MTKIDKRTPKAGRRSGAGSSTGRSSPRQVTLRESALGSTLVAGVLVPSGPFPHARHAVRRGGGRQNRVGGHHSTSDIAPRAPRSSRDVDRWVGASGGVGELVCELQGAPAEGVPAVARGAPRRAQQLALRKKVAILHLNGKGKVAYLAEQYDVERQSCGHWVRTFRSAAPPKETVAAVLAEHAEVEAAKAKAAARSSAKAAEAASAASAAPKKPKHEREVAAYRMARTLAQGGGGRRGGEEARRKRDASAVEHLATRSAPRLWRSSSWNPSARARCRLRPVAIRPQTALSWSP